MNTVVYQVRITDGPNMTSAVYCGRKAINQLTKLFDRNYFPYSNNKLSYLTHFENLLIGHNKCSCTVRFVSDLVGNAINIFSPHMAEIFMSFRVLPWHVLQAHVVLRTWLIPPSQVPAAVCQYC